MYNLAFERKTKRTLKRAFGDQQRQLRKNFIKYPTLPDFLRKADRATTNFCWSTSLTLAGAICEHKKGFNHALINKIAQVFHDFLAGIEFVGLYLVRTFGRKEADMEMKLYEDIF